MCVNCGVSNKLNCYEMNSSVLCYNEKKLILFILCFFLGYLGIYRFYSRRVGTGLLYMFTFGLFGIGIIIDLIRILCGSFYVKNKR
ncbi:TM2 domain-containing protein [Borrelia duttonii]|uniref:Uncharacterized conserved protein n=1 Tax=Borrelia duttonii (strain Ly) TaxID=412419 RepID=B5RNK0_BORDL|nr:uncharacterized conserved protein [Borrelia duttonii Ly]